MLKSIPIALFGAFLLLASPGSAQAGVEPLEPSLTRTVTIPVATQGWTGQVSFGLVTTGPAGARVVRPAPLQLHLERDSCDLGGCVHTSLATPAGLTVPSPARMSASLSSASLGPLLVGVTVTRSVGGVALPAQSTALPLRVVVRKAGDVVRRTALVQSGDAERMTITWTAPVRALIALGDDSLISLGVAEKVRIVAG